MAKFDRYEILTKNYISEIESWNWDKILKEAKSNAVLSDDDQIEGLCWLGTVFGIYPSGKFYMPWTTNQTRSDVIKDECFHEALEEVAGRYGLFITSGEGDACDIFAGLGLEYDEVITWVNSDDEERAKELFEEYEQEVLEESKVS